MVAAAAAYPSDILTSNANEFTTAPRTPKNGCISDEFGCTKKPNDDQVLLTPQKFHRYTCLGPRLEDLPNQTLVFNVEETLLKSSSWFPLFMLVAFEGGSILRALLLLLLYPLIVLLGQEWGLKLMVFVSFFGIKRSTFQIGRTVLPKFLLEKVGYEGFEIVMRFGKRVGVSNLPRVMLQPFLSEYLGIESVCGREIKVVGGYYVGVMDTDEARVKEVWEKVVGEEKDGKDSNSHVVGLAGSLSTISDGLFTKCKDIYLVSDADKEKWHYLPRDKYPKPLLFHDGRLAFWPTPLDTLVMFLWLPFGLLLCALRIFISQYLPYGLSIPLLACLGTSAIASVHKSSDMMSNTSKAGIVYVCSHKTLLDPIYISFICRTPLTALTYSISKTSQILSPIKTITLTRDRQKDTEIMQKALQKGSIVVCPEGTTCREPYLLRFSPLFAEIKDDIVPVAMDVRVSMFYGTTATGIKALDPIFFLMNPYPFYIVKFLEKLPKSHTCGGGMSKFDVANYVQGEIAKAFGYTCTNLTRKDKYLMLAGNTGIY